MTLVFDTEVESVRTGTTDPMTWTHTPVGTPNAIVVAFTHGTSSTDHVVSVTYGGQAMTRIVRATDTATEPGAAELWFLGQNLPAGAQTVSADLATATTDDIQGVSWSLRGQGNAEVIDFDSISENAADPTRTLQKNNREGWCVCAMYGGGAAPGGTLAAGNTLGPTEDLTAFYAQTCRETTITNTDHTIGWSTLASDDLAFVALAVVEITPTATRRQGQSFPPGRLMPRKPLVEAKGEIAAQIFQQALDATVGTTATFVKSVNKTVSATVATTATIVKNVGKIVSATVGTTATIVKSVGKILSATVATTASLTAAKVINLTLSATVATTATMTRQVGKILTATVSTSVTIVKQVNKSLTATVATVASLTAIKVIIVTLSATVGTSATMTRRVNKTVSATVSTTATIVKQVGKTITASVVGTSATMRRQVGKTLSASVATTATMTRSVGKVLSATVSTTSSIVKRVGKTLTAAVGTLASLVRDVFTGGVPVFGHFDEPTPTGSSFDEPSPSAGSLDEPSPSAGHFDEPTPS